MRKLVVLCSALLVVGTFGGTAAASVSRSVVTKAAPVKLQGKVKNKGTKSAKHGKISIETDDYYFKPTFVKAKASTTLTVTIKNEGKQEHTFTIKSQGVDADLQPGKKATVTVMVPATGALMFQCRFHGPGGTSGDFGMQGAIFTKAGQSVGSGSGSSSGGSAAGATVKVASDSKYGKHVVDANNMTLYIRQSDPMNQSTCTGPCLTVWPPLTVTGTPVAGSGITGTLGTITGPNGMQVTLDGHPLYHFASDHASGDTAGEGIGGFFLVGADGSSITKAAASPTKTSSGGSSGYGY